MAIKNFDFQFVLVFEFYPKANTRKLKNQAIFEFLLYITLVI